MKFAPYDLLGWRGQSHEECSDYAVLAAMPDGTGVVVESPGYACGWRGHGQDHDADVLNVGDVVVLNDAAWVPTGPRSDWSKDIEWEYKDGGWKSPRPWR